MHVLLVVGARPNFVKVAPVQHALTKMGHRTTLVHTGQHFDELMDKVFFEELHMPRPDVNLGVGSGSHAQQTAKVMELFEPVLLEARPDWVLVAGDVNSTLACALVARKLLFKVAHLEAGLRSNDWTMPEEINRVLTDQLSHLLLTPSPDADENLKREGIAEKRIEFVGNAMIDTLFAHVEVARKTNAIREVGAQRGEYVLATLHRPSNVDDEEKLRGYAAGFCEISKKMQVIWPVHPRTQKNLESWGLVEMLRAAGGVRISGPLPYLSFLALVDGAAAVVTDSGGIQEETTALGIPCVTVRDNTERPITISQGTNVLAGADARVMVELALKNAGRRPEHLPCPKYWDGQTAPRVVHALERHVGFEQ